MIVPTMLLFINSTEIKKDRKSYEYTRRFNYYEESGYPFNQFNSATFMCLS